RQRRLVRPAGGGAERPRRHTMTAAGAGEPIVTLYGRPGCHLCEDAAALLSRLARELGFRWQSVDIDADARLLALYDQVVPVVALDGAEIARAPIRPAALRERLQRFVGPSPPGYLLLPGLGEASYVPRDG